MDDDCVGKIALELNTLDEREIAQLAANRIEGWVDNALATQEGSHFFQDLFGGNEVVAIDDDLIHGQNRGLAQPEERPGADCKQEHHQRNLPGI